MTSIFTELNHLIRFFLLYSRHPEYWCLSGERLLFSFCVPFPGRADPACRARIPGMRVMARQLLVCSTGNTNYCTVIFIPLLPPSHKHTNHSPLAAHLYRGLKISCIPVLQRKCWQYNAGSAMPRTNSIFF